MKFKLLLIASIVFTIVNCSLGQSSSKVSSAKNTLTPSATTEALIKQANAMGYYSRDEIMQFARDRGIASTKMTGLNAYLLKRERLAEGGLEPGTRERSGYFGDDSLSYREFQNMEKLKFRDSLETYFYGYSLFSNSKYSGFVPNQNAGTPANYIIGPGDELYIDIYGKSEQYYEAKVLPEGTIILRFIGPIQVSGLTIEEAKIRIKNILSKTYTGIKSSNPDTYVNVSLGNIKSILINVAGEVEKPGSYQVSGFTTVLNALHASGGPTVNGSLRDIKVYRNSKLVARLDLYSYLTSGESVGNITLQENDLIIVPSHLGRAQIWGEIKREGYYGVKPEETIEKLFEYAGSFGEKAYKSRVLMTRNSGNEKAVADIHKDQFMMFEVKPGDSISVGKVLDRYENRVQIKGAVFRPGAYAYADDLTITQLIERADGLKEDAYLNKAVITRKGDDLSIQSTSIDLAAVLNGQIDDFVLKPEDVVWVQSKLDMENLYYVKISGEVNIPGTYPFAQGMSVSDLIYRAGGLTQKASPKTMEISRRSSQASYQDQTELINISLNGNLEGGDGALVLMPFDHLMVRKDPSYFEEKTVTIHGEAMYPGTYALKGSNDRLSDLIIRAGGVTELAYTEGASLIRRTEFFVIDDTLSVYQRTLSKMVENMDTVHLNLSEKEYLERVQLLLEREQDTLQENLAARAKKQRLKEIQQRDPLLSQVAIAPTELIPLQLQNVLEKSGSPDDLLLEDGDIINIPKKSQTIRLRGRVLYPTTVRYDQNKNLRYFIDQAGGFDQLAKKGKTYVVYANGEVAKTHRLLFFKFYPDAEAGAEIIVPSKPLRVPLRPAEVVSLTTGLMTSLATLALIIVQIK